MILRRETLVALGLAALPMPGGGALASGGGAAGEGLHLVQMEEVTVPIIDADRVNGVLRFKLVIDAGTAETATKLNGEMPVLRAATVAAGLEFARLNASALRAVDAQQLDHDLTAALKAAEPGLVRVLIVEVDARTG
ncbi:hypothetical protein HNP52_003246 [Sphingomonas kyeonggiensis]|uniref:Uncharacterized protein n=1 Tax=Sphingomonas kyeonggiensis TaxID=1268553 RepID=A0A7W7NTV9_9SPHN|nr:hypothetical protein [Sphingomonas kyeonggiensis]MBB4840154.1 hypothetical protein [Sphingomonas kyeonggiensis]